MPVTKGRALIARGLTLPTIVIATDLSILADDCENVANNTDDIGLCDDPPEAGLYLWEGTVTTPPETDEDVPDYQGTVRPVADLELAQLLAMTPPVGG